jgi:DNA-binding MarR family transcriptional regulator
MEPSEVVELIASECIAVRLRMIHRVVSGLYDTTLRPHGLRVSQMNVLAAVARAGPVRPVDLCRVLRLDKSTLSRDVERLRRRGWLEVAAGDDARSRRLHITPAGSALLAECLPAWRKAQRQARKLLGDEAVAALAGVAKALWAEGARG